MRDDVCRRTPDLTRLESRPRARVSRSAFFFSFECGTNDLQSHVFTGDSDCCLALELSLKFLYWMDSVSFLVHKI